MQAYKCGLFFLLLVAGALGEETRRDDGEEDRREAMDILDHDRDEPALDAADNKTTTTTVAPTTAPKEIPTFRLNATKETYCIIMKGRITLNITYKPYTPLHFEDPKKHYELVKVPGDAIVEGSCALFPNGTQSGDDQNMELSFNGRTVKFVFTEDTKVTKTNNRYAMSRVCLDEDCGDLTGFAVNDGMSYMCTPSQTYNDVLNTTDGGMATLILVDFQAQAFMNGTTFGDEFQCSAMRSNDLVPIIVGSCLAALVVFVLIAYLIGRARAKNSTGYESV